MKVFLVRVLAVFSLLILFSPNSFAMAAAEKPFLWRITSQDATVYLLGSLHAATIDMYPLPAPLYKAFDESNYLVVEIDINKIDAQTQMVAIQKHGLYTDGSRIDQHISKESWQKLKDYLKSRKMSEAMMLGMKPWLINLTVTVGEFTRLGYDTSLGIDQHFLNRAAGKPIISLETLDGQMKVLAGASDKEQESNLVVTLDSVEEMGEMMTTMRTLWQQGDADALYDAIKVDSESYPDFEKQWEALLDTRNIAMAKKIKSYMASDATYFVIVGALHLGGKNGLLSLLGKQGYAVTQVLN
ncbi:TraB/GumN family protein [Gammaproteobacteria bacterium AH-315-C21]|nr:TraB/GumN family protein [Gammaproteobacteria bacterium AH-315-C21]